MHFDTDGIYTLQYTAEDSCGNTTVEEREVDVVALHTVLYTDGTFIINEKSSDRAANIALHGAVTNEYAPFNPNGATDEEKYIFTYNDARPWYTEAQSVTSVEIGSPIAPPRTSYWFSSFSNCTSIDLSNLDTSNVTNMNAMFNSCRALVSLDVSGFNTSNVASMDNMFYQCHALPSLDVSSFDTSAVTNMHGMFYQCRVIPSLDLSSFNTANVVNMNAMFSNCNALVTIYATTDFVVTQVQDSLNMFSGNPMVLVGGSGTTWASANPKDKTYAHIDGGTGNPGYFTAKS